MLTFSRTLLLSISLLVISAVLWVEAGDIPGPNSWQTYGSGFFPQILIGALAGLSALLFLRELLFATRTNAFREIGLWVVTEFRILAAMILFMLYLFSMPRLGFIPATLIYLSASLVLLWHPLDRRRAFIIAVLAVAVTFSVHFIFETALSIRLP